MSAAKRRGLGRGLEALLGETSARDLTESETGAAVVNEQLKTLPLDKIQRGQYQPRVHFEPEALQDLAESIRTQGVIQPIVVRPVGQHYELIAGERRWRAAQLAGLHDIPAVVRSGLPDEVVAAVALIENIQREDLKPLEQARAFSRLIEEFGLTHQQVAAAVGRSRTGVTNMLRLLELNSEVRQMLEQGELEMGHARALLALSGAQQLQAARNIIAQGLSVRGTEKLVKQWQQPKSSANKTTVDPDIKRLEQDLSDTLAAKVHIQHSANGKGKLVVHYTSVDELEGILKRIR